MPRSETPHQWSSKLFTVCGSRYSRVHGLLFSEANKCPERTTQLRLMRASVFDTYKPAVVGAPIRTDSGAGFSISPALDYVPQPRARINTSVFLYYEGDIYETNTLQLYESCQELHKLLGCSGCPAYDTCLEHLWVPDTPIADLQLSLCARPLPPEILPNLRGRNVSDDMCEDDFVSRKTLLEGFTYVNPTYTSEYPTRPGQEFWRPPYKHNFRHEHLEMAEDELRERTLAGVETRKHKRCECSQCIFTCPNWDVRRCGHGRWTQGAFTDAVLKSYECYLKPSFTWEDVWRVAHLGGTEFQFRGPGDSRRNSWCVQGMSTQEGAAVVTCVGNHHDRRHRKYTCLSMEMLRALVPEALTAPIPPLDCDTLALYLLCAYAKDAPTYGCAHPGGFTQCTPRKKFAAVVNGRVVFCYWTSTYTRSHYVNSADALRSWFGGHMPFMRILGG